MHRQLPLLAVVFAIIVSVGDVWAQKVAPPRFGSQLSLGNAALRPNSFEPNEPVAMTNGIVKPMPLSADSQRSALTSIDRRVSDQITALCEKLKTILPDEIAILTKTTGWTTEDRQALVGALRAGDPTAVYETWVKGNAQDTAGAELAAHQTDVKRLMTRLTQDADKNKAALKQDVLDFDTALGKIAGSTPAVSDLATPVKTLKTWVEARQLIETATPGKGPIAKLPIGDDVTLIFDPTLPQGTAIVLSNRAMLIGHEGHDPLTISTGNAAEALGLPIVTGTPLAEVEGQEVIDGVLIVNPASGRGTINYNINGNHYVAEPGMTQKMARAPMAAGGSSNTTGERTSGRQPTSSRRAHIASRRPIAVGSFIGSDMKSCLTTRRATKSSISSFAARTMTVPSGGARTLSSDYPIVVRFDRGNGTEFVARSTPLTVGNLQIGVNAVDNLWDLFPTIDNRRELSTLKPFNAEQRNR